MSYISSYANPENYTNLLLKEIVKKFSLDNFKSFNFDGNSTVTVENFKDYLTNQDGNCIVIFQKDCIDSLHDLGTFDCIEMIHKYENNHFGNVHTHLYNPFDVTSSIASLLIEFVLNKSSTYSNMEFDDEIKLKDIKKINQEIQEYFETMGSEYDFWAECLTDICD